MNNALIIDGVLLLILIVSYLIGAHRGLFRSLMGAVTVIVALVGAAFLSNTFTEPLTELIYPVVEEKVTARFESEYSDEQVNAALEETTQSDIEAFLDGKVSDEFREVLERIGIKEEAVRSFLENAVNGDMVSDLKESAKESASAAISAMAYAVVRSTVQTVLYLILFALLLILLRILTSFFDHLFDLPVLDTLNSFGGGVLGLLEAILLIYLALWVLPRIGVPFLRDNAEHTYLLKFFSTYTPLTLIASLNGGN